LLWEKCLKEEICNKTNLKIWKVDWNHLESIHNFIEKLNFYC
jgi:MFS family permease